MLTRDEYELKGRVVTQYFFDELEKIALSPELIARFAAKRQAQTTARQAATGGRAWMPTSSGAATRSLASKNARGQKLVDEALLKKRQKALQQVQSGRSADVAAGTDMLERLKAINAPTNVVGAARRRLGSTGHQLTPPAEGWSPGARLAAGATGLATAAGAGMYGMHKLRQSQQDPYGGGGY